MLKKVAEQQVPVRVGPSQGEARGAVVAGSRQAGPQLRRVLLQDMCLMCVDTWLGDVNMITDIYPHG